MGITETYVSAGSQRFAACQPNRALCDRHHMQQRKTRCVWCRSFSAGEQPPLSASAVVARPKRDWTHAGRDASFPWSVRQPLGRRRPPPRLALGRATVRPPGAKLRAPFPRDFPEAPLPPPIRSKAPSVRMAVARRSGTRSRTRRERSATTTTATSPMITITDTEMTCGR
jgi:hypothetical protein